ncbi:MAG: aspartyl protease family protein [Kiritimatiellae bacterium]|nr:aspartyl protease family protein [Kiritimatiellia bacterium]
MVKKEQLLTICMLLCLWSGLLHAATDDVPFTVAGRVMFVKAMINDAGPFSFILDSGASQTLVTPPTASRLGIKSYRSISLLKGKIDSIAVGSAVVKNLTVYIYDPPQALPLRLNQGINYHGIIGYTFLSRFITTIDYPFKKVTFSALSKVPAVRKKYGEKNGVYMVPFQVKQGLIHAKGEINGVPLRLLVDTGSAEVVILPKVSVKLKLASSRGGAKAAPKFVTLDSVKLGGVEVKDIQAVIHSPVGEASLNSGYDAIVGYPFLSKFKITLNYRDHVLGFE